MITRKNLVFVLPLLVAMFIASAASAESVYLVGGGGDDGLGQSIDGFTQWPHDGFLFDHLDDLGHDVFYSSGDNSTTQFGEAFDLLVISSTLGSGSVRGKFQDVTTPILHWEEALDDASDPGEFALTELGGDTNNGTDLPSAEITIINPDHPLSARLPAGTYEIAEEPIAQPFIRNPADDVIQIAAHPDESDRIVLAAVEQGAELANGKASPMNLVSFFIQDSHFGHLNEIGLLLFDNSIDWLLGKLDTPRLECDFDLNEACDVDDLDALLDALGTDDPVYDLDGNGTVELLDRDEWLGLASTENNLDLISGDTDLDGKVDSVDLNNLGVSWLSTDNPGWGNGDFDGNDVVNAPDLNDIGIGWQHGVPAGAQAVPEPATATLLLIVLVAMGLVKRRQ